MTDLARIKRNVGKMVGMGAPETDIDAYIASEGVTLEQVRAFKPSGVTQLQGKVQPQAARPTEGSTNIEDRRPNPLASTLPGFLGDFQNFSNAVQAGFGQGLTFGFGDEIYAGATAPIRAVGPMIEGKGYDLGKAYDEGLREQRAIHERQTQLNPIASAAGEVTGAIVNPVTRLAGGAMTKAASLPAKIGVGAAEGAALGGVYGFGTGDSLEDRTNRAAMGAATGGVIGAATPAVSKAIGDFLTKGAQRRATSAAIKGAPSASDLKAASSALFQKVDQSGVTIDPNRFAQFVADQVQSQTKGHLNQTLHPSTYAALEEFAKTAQAALQRGGGSLTISDMHTLRQIAQEAAMSNVGRDGFRAGQLVEALDNFITQPGAAVLPPNRLGQGANTAANDLLEAISTWGRAKRVSLIEEAIYKAGNQASGFENGLRVQFRQLLQNKRTRALFTDAERQAIEEVANGTTLSNAMRLLGKFGFGGGSASNMLGGTVGALGATSFGGPVAGIIAALGATGARKGAEVLTHKAADRAAQVVATPGVPSVAAGPKTLAMQDFLARLGLIGAGPMQQRQPIDITVRGGAN